MTVYFQITCHRLNSEKLDIPLACKADREICGKEEKRTNTFQNNYGSCSKSTKTVGSMTK